MQQMPAIDNSSLAECHKTAILTGLHDSVNIENVSSEVMALIKNEDHSKISRLEFKSKGIALMVCNDWLSCKAITDTYQKAKIRGQEMKITMFSDTDPST